eukprot:790434-Alexandrium_andersonii.AAC.1
MRHPDAGGCFCACQRPWQSSAGGSGHSERRGAAHHCQPGECDGSGAHGGRGAGGRGLHGHAAL